MIIKVTGADWMIIKVTGAELEIDTTSAPRLWSFLGKLYVFGHNLVNHGGFALQDGTSTLQGFVFWAKCMIFLDFHQIMEVILPHMEVILPLVLGKCVLFAFNPLVRFSASAYS